MSVREKILAGLKANEFIFGVENDDLIKLKEMMAVGMHPVCSVCGSRLQVALTLEEAKASGNPPGVVCPVKPGHCQIIVEVPRIRR